MKLYQSRFFCFRHYMACLQSCFNVGPKILVKLSTKTCWCQLTLCSPTSAQLASRNLWIIAQEHALNLIKWTCRCHQGGNGQILTMVMKKRSIVYVWKRHVSTPFGEQSERKKEEIFGNFSQHRGGVSSIPKTFVIKNSV